MFASSDIEGCIKIWDKTNSLLREIYLDKSLCAIEFLSQNNELIISYQNNIHLLLPENYLPNHINFKNQQETFIDTMAEDNYLELAQAFNIPYQLLPTFDYHIKTHHIKRRLQRFEQQLAGKSFFKNCCFS